jgi:hypothetical protein
MSSGGGASMLLMAGLCPPSRAAAAAPPCADVPLPAAAEAPPPTQYELRSGAARLLVGTDGALELFRGDAATSTARGRAVVPSFVTRFAGAVAVARPGASAGRVELYWGDAAVLRVVAQADADKPPLLWDAVRCCGCGARASLHCSALCTRCPPRLRSHAPHLALLRRLRAPAALLRAPHAACCPCVASLTTPDPLRPLARTFWMASWSNFPCGPARAPPTRATWRSW